MLPLNVTVGVEPDDNDVIEPILNDGVIPFVPLLPETKPKLNTPDEFNVT